jgi:23S rRNA (cytosine1962-C5)-methyltransferase
MQQKLYYPKIFIKSGKEDAVLRKHPWIFSGAIAQIDGKPGDGDIVTVHRRNGDFLAIGHYHDGSIAVRVFGFEPIVPDAEFWFQKIEKAWKLRQLLGLTDSSTTDCFRIIHGEGDGMPGLILDYYAGVVVFQAHSIGMHRSQNEIIEGLKKCLGDKLKAVYDKSQATLPPLYAKTVQDTIVFGQFEADHKSVNENGLQFDVNWVTGQKTGFFLDQRDNRALLGKFVAGKTVLNAFCYSGGFSIYALQAGAKQVDSVDASAKAMELVEKNIELNGFGALSHNSYTQDVLKFLQQSNDSYEVMVLDPPAYAKSLDKRHQAIQGYKRLNMEGLKKIAPGGILFTFSCSQVVDRQLFYGAVTAAAIEAGRNVRVLQHISQPADHPVSIFHPEGSYLKGLVLYVE